MASMTAARQPLSLSGIRERATALYTVITWLHVPAVMLIALNARNAWVGPTLILLAIAASTTLITQLLKDGLLLRSLVAIALTAGPILFVYAGRGASSGIAGHGDWQIDYHMYFFAVFAMLIGYMDWRPIMVSAALTAGHHLLFDLFAASAVFPEEGLDRVALHAIVVAAECCVLIWTANMVQRLFARIDDLMDFTTKATAEAIAGEVAEKTALQAEIARLRIGV